MIELLSYAAVALLGVIAWPAANWLYRKAMQISSTARATVLVTYYPGKLGGSGPQEYVILPNDSPYGIDTASLKVFWSLPIRIRGPEGSVLWVIRVA